MRNFACSAFATPAHFFLFDCTCSLAQGNDADETRVEELLDAASDLLCILSGYRLFGRCTRTFAPFGYGGSNCVPAHDFVWASYGPLDAAIELPGPNPTVTSITIAGDVLASSAYRIVENRLLRVDGESWPTYNTFIDDGTGWTIGVTFGYDAVADIVVRDAACELACELDKPISERRSNLKMGVTSVNLQGVTASLEDDADALREGHQNLPSVERFLGIWNPDNAHTTFGVWSVDQAWTLYDMTTP